MSSLTANDTHVLSALFDPESSPSAGAKISPEAASLPNVSQGELSSLQAQEHAAIVPLNTTSPDRASIDNAIRTLTELIQRYPDYAPAYANRAQALRLRLGKDTTDAANREDVSLIFADLECAISLAAPVSPQDPVSPMQANVLATAYAHRGYQYLKATNAAPQVSTVQLLGAQRDVKELEELASRDFFMAGMYGNKVAQRMAVKTNPYAKMCGAIVKEALRDEIESVKLVNKGIS
ncbi:hypothetical protein LTS18_010115 [Coniosporium uncinatum]|uniref:Uncharacterized protein n=1 Tax=Coniosporium uncinatum TaxID=93489 RepID=A0ACC3DZD2_9PEZI|nr:hypothetical protein LTS18_010115 [Coniosporium uncinatum]